MICDLCSRAAAQVKVLTEKYHIYLLANGRINMCGVTIPMVDHLATAITDAVVNTPACSAAPAASL